MISFVAQLDGNGSNVEEITILDKRPTFSGASSAMRTTIHPPWLVPSTNAFRTLRASITWRAMVAVSQ